MYIYLTRERTYIIKLIEDITRARGEEMANQKRGATP